MLMPWMDAVAWQPHLHSSTTAAAAEFADSHCTWCCFVQHWQLKGQKIEPWGAAAASSLLHKTKQA
jgi:hypothetical protein